MSCHAGMIHVNSSAIRAVGCDGSTLTVEFHRERHGAKRSPRNTSGLRPLRPYNAAQL